MRCWRSAARSQPGVMLVALSERSELSKTVSEMERSEMEVKKASEEANARYNEMLYYGLGTEEEP